ncbi:centriolar coiled-coil protein of 110 kDa [Danio aesculapii]|uniref:centriolar coiled-coil protein of 110 kDa n=1 Tax=Danio aesculapii TaxID=1142201 RepID=UPI0024BF3258|nr:centriolar coiled-coil protein of 110 kDa [Danio aesculapii]
MESYEDFIQRCYNSNNADDAEDEPHTPVTSSSLIVFHGASILPPVLNEQQRVEMRTLRDTAVSLMTMKRRMRREEESQTSFADVSISDAEQHTTITDSDIIISAPPTLLTCHPLTSTAHDDRSANHLRASPEAQSLDSTQITVLFEGVGHKNDRSHDALDIQTAMMSSGYVTNDNTDLSLMEAAAVRSGSDIISHAPVDGAILEAEAVEVSPLKMAEDVTDSDEGPYRMSLQNLLKKSQEYRRRQRLLRTQAKALMPAVDEHSLSDKENEELPKHIWKTELRKAREKKKEKADLINTDVLNQTNTHTANHEDISAVFTALPVSARALYASKVKPVSASRSHLTVDHKYANIPTPQFCLSPVRCKKGGGASAHAQKALSRSDLRTVTDGGLVQTQQIAQLELNLSSLKTLISDLESTLTLSHADQSVSPGDNCVKRNVTFGGAVQQEVIAKDCGIEKQTSFVGVLTDNSNHSDRIQADGEGSSLIGSSYDVDAPSSLWSQLTPEVGGHEGVSRVKRRLLMNEETHCSPTTAVVQSSVQTQEDPVTFLMEEERRQQQELLQPERPLV